MISVEYDADLPEGFRQAIHEAVRTLLPSCDPDGRGRLEIRIATKGSSETQVEVSCEEPHVRAIVVDSDGATALRRALARFGETVGIPSHSVRKTARR
ncbi:MAG: hypothetical protein KC619_03340 [Myxococcales bacterium]|nr:hypothetical protein [Myxococcales bacterium]